MNVYLLRSWTHHEPKRPKGAPGLRQAGYKPPAGMAAVMLHLGNVPVSEDVSAAWVAERFKELGLTPAPGLVSSPTIKEDGDGE